MSARGWTAALQRTGVNMEQVTEASRWDTLVLPVFSELGRLGTGRV